jgi:hypothetical protein
MATMDTAKKVRREDRPRQHQNPNTGTNRKEAEIIEEVMG